MLGFPSLASRLVEVRQRVVQMVPLQRLRRDQVKDGWIDATGSVGTRYPYFIVFYVLCHRSIVVFCLSV
jgi:hypothetical protein